MVSLEETADEIVVERIHKRLVLIPLSQSS